MFRLIKSLLCALSVALGSANATPISYEFTTNWYQGALTGVITKGYFSYDSARVVPGKTLETLDFFTDFSFSLKGIRYTELTVNTAQVSFNETGDLQSAVFGPMCYFSLQIDGSNIGTCAAMPFFVNYNASHPLYAALVLDSPYPASSYEYSLGKTTIRLLNSWEVPAEVPEPGIALLFMSGLVALRIARRQV